MNTRHPLIQGSGGKAECSKESKGSRRCYSAILIPRAVHALLGLTEGLWETVEPAGDSLEEERKIIQGKMMKTDYGGQLQVVRGICLHDTGC